jgi:ATP-dependent RNA helicase DeaD
MSTEIISQFSQLALAPEVLHAVNEVGYETPSPIQAQSIPPLLEGRDLLGQAQTGTGKTAAFALPLLSRIDVSQLFTQLLVLTPTRELAIQVAEAMQKYARYIKGFHILPVYGGQGMSTQLRQLKRGVHAVVGTPGRILDHLRRGTLALDQLNCLVLDEADEMLRMGFIDDVHEILDHAPQSRQIALFSATMPEEIRHIARKYLHNPVEIRIPTKTLTVASINQRYWQVTGTHKIDALTRILEIEDFEAIIIFVRTKTETIELAEKLEARGYACSPLNGDMNQPLRERTIENLRNGNLDIVIATDVAARGLNVERISHVINYDIPTDTEAYVHRIGRTGRAGKKGEAILFVSPREQRMLRAIEKATRQPITPMQLPSHDDIVDRRITQFKQTISKTLEAEELGFFEDLVTGYQQEHNVGLSEVAAALAFLVQKERPLIIKKKTAKEKMLDEQLMEKERERSERPDRPRRERSRGERNDREKTDQSPVFQSHEEGMARYRIEVGRAHGVQPKHIVGAVANEAGIDSKHIGQIKLYEEFSTIDLPDDLSKDILKHLQKVWVCGQQLHLSAANEIVEERTSKPRSRRLSSERPERSSERRERSSSKPKSSPKKR